ncbi:MAG TPA: PSD1 and planctomycete cytochrome C domain-containing protein [Vicinamibacterales bacterium]
MTKAHASIALAFSTFAAVTTIRIVAQVPAAKDMAPLPTPAQAEFFEANIRPVLLDTCGECHTDDEKGDLRVDSRAALLKGGEHGPAIVPGDPDKSLLIQTIRREGDAPKMPKKKPKLPDQTIAAFAEWVRQGAPWPAAAPAAGIGTNAAAAPAAKPPMVITAENRAWWSFKPLTTPVPPAPDVRNAEWPKTDVDRFVLARLEREGLEPVRPAGRRTLIRRATFDLTGLPPTPDEVDAFEKDTSTDAFAKVVDRLLASPRYGEAWGRHWLDVARYAEDDPRSLDPMRRGFNPYPNAYLYRDWVVKAFNDDLPYDRFVKAQLAADQFDDPDRVRHLAALGFLGIGPWYYDNGSVEVTHADERHDRVDVVSRGFLGLTVACARCHDHKYDPIPQRDYYALAGVFLNSEYHEYPLAPKSVVDDYKALEKKKKNKQELLDDFTGTESRQLAETLSLQSAKYMLAAWRVTGEPKNEAGDVASTGKLDYELLQRWIRFLAKPPKFYPYLKKWQEMVKAGGTEEEAKALASEFQDLAVEVMFQAREVKDENDIIRAKALPGTRKKEKANLPNEFVTNDDFCPGCGLELKSLDGDRAFLYADMFRDDLVDSADPANLKEEDRPGLFAFRGPGLDRWLGADRRRYIDELRDDIKAIEKAMPPKFTYVHGVADAAKLQTMKVAIRGNPFKPGDEVTRHFPSVLVDGPPAAFSKGSGRLELATAIAAQPIAARVIVNRVWKWHFGTGLVNSPSNFGKLGDPPSNPELLEYLASWFVEHGRSLKQLHRLLMLSAVYQSSDDDSPAAFAKDSGNRWYWRANRRRMTAEELRDASLFSAGALDLKMGGPSADLTPASTRRTLYGKVSRYKLDSFLQLFDFPAPTISAEQRFSTNVPLQRLFLMNSDFMQQQAERLARLLEAEPDNAARIRKAYRTLFGREPLPEEVTAGLAYLSAEPLRSYEERKAADDKKQAAEKNAPPDQKKPAPKKKDEAEKMGEGMMAGVMGAAGSSNAEDDKKRMLPVTPLGRYLKVLLSSNEFLFID